VTPLTWTELDRLADYTAGLLNDAAATEVAELIRTDARWAHAHQSLVTTEPTVRSRLEAAGQHVEPMPDDVVARINAVLADAAVFGAPSQLRPSPVSRTTRSRSRGWKPMYAGLTAAAAAVIAVAGGAFVVGQGAFDTSIPGMAANDADGRESPELQPAPTGIAPGADSGSADSPWIVIASGVDYQLDTLPDLAAVPMASTQSSRAASPAAPDLSSGPLGEFSDEGTLARCLDLVLIAYPGTVTLVDYARFEGDPAIVIVVRNNAGSTVVAVGPECGEAGTDELASVRV
jgi:hypothetical protein